MLSDGFRAEGDEVICVTLWGGSCVVCVRADSITFCNYFFLIKCCAYVVTVIVTICTLNKHQQVYSGRRRD